MCRFRALSTYSSDVPVLCKKNRPKNLRGSMAEVKLYVHPFFLQEVVIQDKYRKEITLDLSKGHTQVTTVTTLRETDVPSKSKPKLSKHQVILTYEGTGYKTTRGGMKLNTFLRNWGSKYKFGSQVPAVFYNLFGISLKVF